MVVVEQVNSNFNSAGAANIETSLACHQREKLTRGSMACSCVYCRNKKHRTKTKNTQHRTETQAFVSSTAAEQGTEAAQQSGERVGLSVLWWWVLSGVRSVRNTHRRAQTQLPCSSAGLLYTLAAEQHTTHLWHAWPCTTALVLACNLNSALGAVGLWMVAFKDQHPPKLLRQHLSCGQSSYAAAQHNGSGIGRC